MGTPEVIRRRRLELGLTVHDLATTLGVDVRQIRRYENGDAQPTLNGARLLAERLHITLDELAGGPPSHAGAWWSVWADTTHGTLTAPVELHPRGNWIDITTTTTDAAVAVAACIGKLNSMRAPIASSAGTPPTNPTGAAAAPSSSPPPTTPWKATGSASASAPASPPATSRSREHSRMRTQPCKNRVN